jgi:SAM-dependent methyltransferase
MFFPNKIVSIEPHHRVLEVGPGGSPHNRSDVLLERRFSTNESAAQRGFTDPLVTNKELVFYDGGVFPFKDSEFDYVICSHVVEHVPFDELDQFLSELTRVAKAGYLEFPTIYYDFIYNFKVHITVLLMKDGELNYMSKNESGIDQFFDLQSFFYKSLERGHVGYIDDLNTYFFQGFEWFTDIKRRKVSNISDVLWSRESLVTLPYKNIAIPEVLVRKSLIKKIKSFVVRLAKKIINRY